MQVTMSVGMNAYLTKRLSIWQRTQGDNIGRWMHLSYVWKTLIPNVVTISVTTAAIMMPTGMSKHTEYAI